MNNTSDKFTAWQYRNIALAVVTQCAQLVNSLAFTGQADNDQTNACIAPLLVLDPDSPDEVYPDVGRFSNGLNTLQQALGSAGVKEFGEPVKYVLGMTVLQQQLMAVPSMQALIRRRLQLMRPAFLHAGPTPGLTPAENALSNDSDAQVYDFSALAALYQDSISKLTYRIHVKGNIEHLQDQRVADRIRALLLAGIRSALLWHQLGGRRWHLFFYKKRIRDCIADVRRSLLVSS